MQLFENPRREFFEFVLLERFLREVLNLRKNIRIDGMEVLLDPLEDDISDTHLYELGLIDTRV